jgi:hypothetical protein
MAEYDEVTHQDRARQFALALADIIDAWVKQVDGNPAGPEFHRLAEELRGSATPRACPEGSGHGPRLRVVR